MIENIQQTRLDNGLTVLTDKMSGVRSASLAFMLRAGARHEPANLSGISHFIEHAVFKGTQSRSAYDIAVEQDRLGGGLEAFTTHEETGFAVKVIDTEVSAAFDLIADMLVNPAFDDAELESEQRVIIEEMKMTDDSPEDLIGEIFNQSVFSGHPLGRKIVGTPKSVRGFDRAVTAEYHSRVYNAANLVIAAAGNVEHEQIVELARAAFGHGAGAAVGPEAAPTIGSPIVIRKSATLEQAQMILATPFVSGRDERRYAADLLADVLGGGTSSRMWQSIREQHGLAYSVGASSLMYRDCGLFTFYAGTSPDQVSDVVRLAVDELRSVVRGGLTRDELELAKERSRAAILLGLEDSAARVAVLVDAEILHGRQISVDETLAKLDGVALADIQALAAEFFRSENVSFAALGNLNGLTINRADLSV